jgi:hypothetical protein
MPREKRLEAKNEICRAHFNLGSNDVSKWIIDKLKYKFRVP